MKVIETLKLSAYRFLNLFMSSYEHNGKRGNWIFASRLEDPAKRTKPDAVVVIPFLKGKPVLIRQFRVPVNDYVIEFPAGLIDGDETPESAARREIKEETGLEITKILWESPTMFNSPGITDECAVVIAAEVEGEISTSLNESSEDIEVFIPTANDIYGLVAGKDKDLMDAKVFMFLRLGGFMQGLNFHFGESK